MKKNNNKDDVVSSLFTLSGRVAVVTGGSRGIGAAIAYRLAQAGADVAIVHSGHETPSGLTRSIEKLGRTVANLPDSDVSKDSVARRVVREVIEKFGYVDILVNNAGIYPHSLPERTAEAEWDRVLDTNLKGAFLMSKFALPPMIGQGSGVIINNSSGWGLVGGDRAVAYCASKGGMVLMTKAMAIDHGRQGIRVNCICPGDVDTPMLPADARLRGLKWEEYLAGCSTRAMGRIGTPEEIARAVLFLASEDSSFMTGAALVVDGGGTAD